MAKIRVMENVSELLERIAYNAFLTQFCFGDFGTKDRPRRVATN